MQNFLIIDCHSCKNFVQEKGQNKTINIILKTEWKRHKQGRLLKNYTQMSDI